MERCRQFLVEKDPQVAQRAGQAIRTHLEALEALPELGRPYSDIPGLRELVIPFGESGYVALYRFEPTASTVYLLAFRHQRETGYQ